MILDRSTPPAIHDAIEFEYTLPPIHTEQLSNGLQLYWLNAGVQDVVEIDWIFPAGLWFEQKPAVAQATGSLLKNGTSKRSAQEINEAFEFYGANLKVNAGNDFTSVTLYALTKHLPKLLPIVYDLLTDAVFPEEEVQLYKQNAIQLDGVGKGYIIHRRGYYGAVAMFHGRYGTRYIHHVHQPAAHQVAQGIGIVGQYEFTHYIVSVLGVF